MLLNLFGASTFLFLYGKIAADVPDRTPNSQYAVYVFTMIYYFLNLKLFTCVIRINRYNPLCMTRTFATITAIAAFISSIILTASPAYSAGRTLNFSGYTWNVKAGYNGPGPNYWTDNAEDVFVDAHGALHLKVIQRDGAWRSSEVWLSSSLGYGTYEFDITTRVDQLDPQIVAAPFLYQDDTHEIDIEYSRWGYPNNQNTWYNIQPWSLAGNQKKFTTAQGAAPITARIEWAADRIILSTLQNGATINTWTYTGANNFAPNNERVHINFWMYEAKPPQSGATQELIVTAFRFTPISIIQTTPQPIIEPAIVTKPPQQKREPRKRKLRLWR